MKNRKQTGRTDKDAREMRAATKTPKFAGAAAASDAEALPSESGLVGFW